MTELLYLPDNEYEKTFESKVEKAREVDGYIVLAETLFYPEGGGQPADRGKIFWDGADAEVVEVQKKSGDVRHFIEGNIPDPGKKVAGEIDWDRRFNHMKMHTAQHVVSKVVLEEYGASTAGNQIHKDRSRIDFKPVEFEQKDIEKIQKTVNSMIQRQMPVKKKMMPRERVEASVEEGRTNLELIPDHVDPLRVVEFGDDLCPCGGTHVDNIEEIGKIEIVDRASKGAEVERIEFTLK